MALHPGQQMRHFPEELPVAWDPIRRGQEENEDWYRDLVEHSQDLLCVHDLEGRFLSINPVPARLLGYCVEEVLAKPMRDFIDPQFRAQFDVYLREIARAGQAEGLLALLTRSGEQRIWEYHNTLRREGVETPIVRGIAHDVTERVQAERALRANNEQLLKTVSERERILRELTLFRTLLDQANDAIQVLDPETLRFLDVNERACMELGYSREELLSMTVFDIDKDINEIWRARVRQQVRESGFAIMERVHRRKDGTTFPVEVNFRKVQLEREYGVAVTRNITARKRAEEALRESELRFRAVYERSPVGIALVDSRTGLFLQVNPKFCEIAGRGEEELVGMDVRTITHPDDVGDTNEYLRQLAEEKLTNYEIEKRYVRPDGSVRWVRILVVPMWGDGEAGRWQMGLVQDITEHRRAEEALRESERRHQLALQTGKIGAFELELGSGRGTWTAEFAEIWGVPRGFAGDFAAFFRWELVHPEDRARVQKELAQLVQSREEGESDFRVIRPDGAMRWIRGRGQVIADTVTGSLRVVGVNMDITERKRAEEAIATLAQVRADSSGNFFTSMASQLARCLEADYTLIGELIEGEEGKVRTIGVCNQGAIADNFTYDLVHTPCEGCIAQGARSYVAGVAEKFPKDLLLQQMKVEGYVGTPLRDSQGRALGIMVAAYTRPLANAKFAEAILQLFSTRTAAEIERQRTDRALRQSEERFRVALKHSPIAVYNLDRDLRYTWVHNPQIPQPASEQLGKTAADLFEPEEATRITEARRRVLETGVGVRHEMRVTFGGRKQYLSTTIEPVLDSAGAVIGLTGASMDVTELRETSEALREAKRKLTEEKLYLEQEIDAELGLGEIIGESKALHAMMEQVAKVAASDATVLLLGETGTGKELVARAIHQQSQRANNSFIKMNCAAIPSGLLESELFGNEKGAFTGAVSKKIGRLELADKGTLFLDEIGEIPLALQPKLLRVLQDQEFERLGGIHTLKVDFRLIAATNRDLADAVREKEFRSDLYYRLNVFPIRLPPLRERREDIRLLVEHFVQKCARRMNKSITSIPKRTVDALMGWEWPGNVRELENFIERSVILTQGSVLVAPLSELTSMTATEEEAVDESLGAAERDHILRALRESHGQIGGPRGAAMRLGLKRTTLQSKLKQLGINPRTTPPGR